MANDTGADRRWRRRAITVISLGVTTVVAAAAPAFGHPVFSNDPPGFPNPQGSTVSPYPGDSRPTMNMFLPFEQDGVVFNEAENTTVDVKVTVPAGWTNPACGAARTSPAVGYRQVGTVVPGWTCAIETVSAHQVLHWHGPQVSASQGYADSAQFFTFQVTVPSPATQTNYGANGGPEGFYVEQVYASTVDFSLWRTPNSTRPGEVANGIVRTVAGTTPRDPNLPKATPFVETHQGPNKPQLTPPGANPAGTKALSPSPAVAQGGSGPTQGGSGPTPAPEGLPSSSGPPAAGDPSPTAQDSPAPTSTEPPPGADAQSSSAKQLAQQRDDATGHGVGWQVLAGIVVGAALVVGAVIAVVQRRRRSS